MSIGVRQTAAYHLVFDFGLLASVSLSVKWESPSSSSSSLSQRIVMGLNTCNKYKDLSPAFGIW